MPPWSGLSRRLLLFNGLFGWSLALASVAVLVWLGLQLAGRPLPVALRRRVLFASAAFACSITIGGLYIIAEDTLM